MRGQQNFKFVGTHFNVSKGLYYNQMCGEESLKSC